MTPHQAGVSEYPTAPLAVIGAGKHEGESQSNRDRHRTVMIHHLTGENPIAATTG